MTRRRLLGVAFLAWEVWWTYVYVTTPRPDDRMFTVAAELLALWIPGAVVTMAVGLIVLRQLLFMRS